jgi:hypothetical protein
MRFVKDGSFAGYSHVFAKEGPFAGGGVPLVFLWAYLQGHD